MTKMQRPFFTIGITTYNRKELLKRCLLSLINQSFTDFEVIVGNDYVAEPINGQMIGINDKRIKFVNHEKNLGERNNLNKLLDLANGEYFTWQFDDDMYALDFLEKAYNAIQMYANPICIYSSYRLVVSGDKNLNKYNRKNIAPLLLNGHDFLNLYFKKKIRVMGFTGVYELEYLKSNGGAVALTNGKFALYSEYLLLVQTLPLKKVVYINSPLVYFYAHETSWGYSNTEMDLYFQGGINLIRESWQIFDKSDNQNNDFLKLSVLKLILYDIVKKSFMKKGVSGIYEIKKFLNKLFEIFYNDRTILSLRNKSFFFYNFSWILIPFLKAKSQKLLPFFMLKPLIKLNDKFQ